MDYVWWIDISMILFSIVVTAEYFHPKAFDNLIHYLTCKNYYFQKNRFGSLYVIIQKKYFSYHFEL